MNVGGRSFTTSWTTLKKAKSSRLEEMLSCPEPDGSYFIDRDGRHFHHILNFLRDGPSHFSIPVQPGARSEILREAEAYGMTELAQLLSNSNNLKQRPLHPTQGELVPAGSVGGELAYVGAARPKNEEERLQRLHALDILHTATDDPKYDNITSVVAAICDVPIVLVSLVAENEQWFKSRCGLDAMSTSRDTSFCATMMKPEEPDKAFMLVIEDAEQDPRVANNPLVVGPPYIRFYAGCPLVTSDGLRLGALCSIDTRPRTLSAWQGQVIINFATICVTEIEAAQVANGNDKSQGRKSSVPFNVVSAEEFQMPAFTHGPARAERMRAALREGVLVVFARSIGMDWPVFYANRAWQQMAGLTVISPKRLSSRAHVSSESDPNFCSDIIWEWMRLQDPSGQDGEVIRVIMDELSRDGRTPRAFAVNTVLRTPGCTPQQLRCKFTPASMAMDVNSACIQPPFALNSVDEVPPTAGGPGFFFFVTIAINENKSPPLSASSFSATTNSNGIGQTPGDEGGSRKNTSGNTLASLSAMKPARSPFADVRLISPVGEGSFAKVYFGLWSGSPVAIKVIEQKDTQDAEQPFKPVFEATLSASICHPNLVQTYKFSSRQKEHAMCEETTKYWETWIVQEWCDKGTLGNYLQECSGMPLNVTEAMEEILEISRAGSYLHSRGIIHGDLTGNNVLLRSDVCRKGHVCKVCDFGLARVLDEESREVITNTLGTVTHMPPELFLPTADGGCLTPKADVYAAGILLWQTLTRKRPFDGMLAPQVVVKVAQGRRPVLPPEIPANVAKLYHDCVSFDANSRPTFDAVLERVAEVMSSLG